MKQFKNDIWIFQIYYPEIIKQKCAIYFNLNNRFTICWAPTYAGFGFEILGFGAALVYAPKTFNPQPPINEG